MKLHVLILSAIAALTAVSCSMTRHLPDGEYSLAANRVLVRDNIVPPSEMEGYITQKAVGAWDPQIGIYNLSNENSQSLLNRFLRKLGKPPVAYNPAAVDATVQSMLNHLEYIGYYGSSVESMVQVRKRNVYVTYLVDPGKRFRIGSIEFDLPDAGEFKEDFLSDVENISIKEGDFLAASTLEEESVRSSSVMRNMGYYGLTKNHYSFVADTLSDPGIAHLTMAVKEYVRTGTEADARPLRKYYFNDVSITHDDNIRIRPRILSDFNLIHPGQMYRESVVNNTYSRMSYLNVFNSVNVSLTEVDTNKVDAAINLQHSRLQGFKFNLEGSTNSTGLFGISPQLNYYHKNIFHGGERLNVSLKGNFQSNPSQKISSTEFGASASISFPKMLGFPNRLFKGPSIPRTDVTASFNYQNRPEFRMSIINGSYGYSGTQFSNHLYYQVYPLQVNLVRIFDISRQFRESISNDPYLSNVYHNHCDFGVGGTFYYTTDASASPQGSYHYARLGVDLSGNVLSLLNPYLPQDGGGSRLIWGTPYSQYVKGEMQLGKTFSFGGSRALALRFLAGAGYAYGNSTQLPFEKKFYVGGASSMRGWQARTLGPGNSKPAEYFIIPNQTGDVKLELDIEYRFGIVSILKGAVFAEAGNIWGMGSFLSDDEKFSFKTLPGSIAADWGIGLRVDAKMILVRVDMGMKVHNPVNDPGERWINPGQWLKRDNRTIHFGIGYPF